MNAPVIVPERLAQLAELPIHRSSHSTFESGHCAMELVAWLANEPHSDRPSCACPVISRFVVNWNDGIKIDEERTAALRPLLPIIVGTRSTKDVERRRGWLCADWAVRDSAPAWLEWAASFGAEVSRALAERTKSARTREKALAAVPKFEALKDHAARLRNLPELVDIASKDHAWPVLQESRRAVADAASAVSAVSAAYVADAASAASAADAASAASAAYVAYVADAAYAAGELRSARVRSAQDLVRRLCEVSP